MKVDPVSVGSLLVKSFQVWMKSPVGRQMMVHAQKVLAPQVAKVATMGADKLVLSARAATQLAGKSAVQVAGKAATRTVAQAASRTASQAAGQVAGKVASKAAGTRVLSQGEKLIAARRVAMNSIAGDRREMIVRRFLAGRFPAEKGFTVLPEQYLRNSAGQIARDAAGHGRRLDFVVLKGNRAVSAIEVTSKTASKAAQAAKDLRIREAGGRYLLNPETGKLVKLRADQLTQTLRLH